MLEIDEIVRNKARALGAEHWLVDLPDLVAELERDWSLTVGHSHQGGTESFVADARLADGSDAVLKVLIPHGNDAASHEITALQLADGDGCARLLRSDAVKGAMLVERLGRTLFELALPIDRRHDILCATAARVWRPAPGCGLPTGADKGRRLADFIEERWELLDHPCSERAVEHAIDCAGRRVAAHDDERAVLVHGDVHQWNALEAGDHFKLVDPDGLLAEAEYDLGILMREDPVELVHDDPFARAQSLAARTGLDATAIWEWGVVERVSTGLLLTQIDLQPIGREMLAAAEHVAG